MLKVLLIYGFLSLPFSFYDETYGMVYRKVAGVFFSKFRDNGSVVFREWKEPAMTRVNIGSYAIVNPDGTFHTAAVNINTRYMGYFPTILLIALVLASPVPWNRKLFALAAGLILLTLLIMFKQWIALLWLCEQNTWLRLTDFTGTSKKLLTFLNTFISDASSTVLYFVFLIWFIVTFRLEDLKIQNPKSEIRNPKS